MSDPGPRSPCISVCILNDRDVCIGCYRSASEITDWFTASVQEKHEILARARERMARDNPIKFS